MFQESPLLDFFVLCSNDSIQMFYNVKMQRHGEIEVKHGNQSQIDKGSIYKSLQQRYNFNDYRYIKDVVRLVIDND